MKKPFKITGPGFYRTRDGRRARVTGRSVLVDWPFRGKIPHLKFFLSWRPDGSMSVIEKKMRDEDLVAPWNPRKRKPKKKMIRRTRWVNVYPNGVDRLHLTRKIANVFRDSERIACVRITYEFENKKKD